MKKIKLPLQDIYLLVNELKGVKNTQTGEVIRKGLLDEKLSINTKYGLNELSNSLLSIIEPIEKLKEEAITRLGEQAEDNSYYIPMRINEVYGEDNILTSAEINPNFIKYQEEINELSKEEFEIEYREILLEKIDIETEVNPNILFKLITL